MDNPGHSIFGGMSLHLEGIRTSDLDGEEEEEQNLREEEEENKRREEELKEKLAGAFDDLEEDESYANQISHYSTSSNQLQGNSIQEEGSSERRPEVSYVHDDVNSQRSFENSHGSINEYDHVDPYASEGLQNQSLGDHATILPTAFSSSQRGVPTWGNDSQDDPNQYNPFVAHETDGDFHILSEYQHPQEDNFEINRNMDYNDEGPSYEATEAYNADDYKSSITENESAKEILRNQYKDVDTAYDQLKLLYEARGREIDKLTSEFSKLKFESSRNTRVLQHQLNLLKSDSESKAANINQLQILLTKKDERIKNLISDFNEVHDKFKSAQDENSKLHFELETAESTISSLECQISELKAADSLTRNQQIHDNFVRKLQQGSKEEKDLLMTKLQEAQREIETYQQEIKRLRDELKNLRATYDDALIQKSETVTKLTLTIENVRKQYEDLLQAHDSKQLLELQLKIKDLESNKHRLESKVCSLEQDLAKSKEELEEFDTSMKIALFSKIAPVEESLEQLGIKRKLNYDDAQTEDTRKGDKLTETQDKFKLQDELKKSLLINKVKRDKIRTLKEENALSQLLVRKAESDLKDAHIEINELRGNLMKLKLEHAECQLQDGNKTADNNNNAKAVQAENISLRQELTLLHNSYRKLKYSLKELNDLIHHLKSDLSNMNSENDCVTLNTMFDKWLQEVELGKNFITDTEQFQKAIAQVREDNHKLYERQVLWEKRMNDMQIILKVSEKMIVSAINDQGRGNEYNHACNTLQKLLEDLQQLMKNVQEENSGVYNENMNLRDQLTNCHLELEHLKEKVDSIKEQNKVLEEEMTVLSKKKDEERILALEDCQSTYLRFHEQAVRELEMKIKTQYESIAQNLKGEISRLSDELNNTKELYIKVCQEKDGLELELEKAEAEKSESRDQGGDSDKLKSKNKVVETPDSHVTDNSGKWYRKQPFTMYKKTIEDLETELANLKERYSEDNKKMVIEKENLNMKYKKQVEEIQTIRQESHKSVEDLQKKCLELEKCNVNLEDKCRRLEEEILMMKENNRAEVDPRQPEGWRLILERQQKRVDEEKEEMKRQYETLIQDLQNKYAKAESSKLLEKKVKEQEEEIKILENKVKDQEKNLKTISNELERMKEREKEEKENECVFEQEIHRLTDMVQNLESELKEKQEENEKAKVARTQFVQDLQDELETLRKKLLQAEEEVGTLRQIQDKYKSLKQRVTKYHSATKQENSYYKEEMDRLAREYASAKQTLLDRVRVYIEEIKLKCIFCIDSIISSLRGLENMHYSLDATLLELEELAKELKDFTLQLK
nr:centrosomal protein of 152 kDa-like [Procambarus clarkii]XP_045606056.1 centrosomal protein of 152 kDa-like [Procambarus clarkii]